MTQVDAVRTAIVDGAPADEFAALEVPESFRAAVVRADETEMFEGVASEEKDPRKSVHIDEVPMPELAPDEALVAVMASSINFNTVWTSIFEPMPTFAFLARLGKESVWGKRHDQPYHIVGSDAAGVVLRVGSAVRLWKPGDAVTVHSNHVDDQDPSAHDDSMLATNQRIWGYETNFGGLGEFTRREGESAHAEARAPHVGGSGGQRAHQRNELPHAGEPERRTDDPGSDRPDLGCREWHRRRTRASTC